MNLQLLQTLMCSPGISGRRGLRPLFWGKPGIGKTAQIEALSKAMGAWLISLIASIREPSDFLGIPMPDGKGGMMYAAPAWAIEANAKAKKGQLVIVFIDELTTCPPAVQSALLRVVNEGWVGDVQLHENVVFLSAANPPEIASGGYDLSPPMANRYMHLQWGDPTAKDFSEGILSDWADTLDAESAASVMARIDKRHPVTLARAKGLVTGFLRAQSQYMIRMPAAGTPEAESRAWPSPRTWDLTIAALAGVEANGLPETAADDFLAGCVGTGVAAELRQYQAAADLPDPAKLLDAKDPAKVWVPNPERPDITAAVLNSCAALVTPKKADKRMDRADAMWGLIGETTKHAGDVATVAARSIARAGLTNTPKARGAMTKLGGIMTAMKDL